MPSGVFSIKSAWEVVRKKRRSQRILSQVWENPITMQSKLLMWRVLKGIIPVDTVAKKQGFHLASKCMCCARPEEESLHHLFGSGELAAMLWNFFGAVFAVPYFPFHSSYARVAWWFHRCRGSSQFAILGRAAAIAIFRQLWSFRNNFTYGGAKRSFVQAKVMVIDVLQQLDGLIKPKRRNSFFGIDSLLMLGIKARDPPVKPLRRCKWIPPSPEAIALNVDGSMINHSMAVGGVFRDRDGCVLGAYAGPVGRGSSLQAEILGLHHGLQLADQWGFNKLEIWSDSKMMVDYIGKPSPDWQRREEWKEIQVGLLVPGRSISHILREGNYGADALSKWGHDLLQLSVFHSYDELPLRVRNILDKDADGFVYWRRPRGGINGLQD